jgi:hypothetical protein
MDIPKSKGRDGFWEAYRGCAEENRVRPDRSPFYVNWAKDFANFLPEKPLKDRSRKDVETFLANLGKRRGIADWQVRQAEHALRILYEIFFATHVSFCLKYIPFFEFLEVWSRERNFQRALLAKSEKREPSV